MVAPQAENREVPSAVWPRHDIFGSFSTPRRLRHEVTPRPARPTNRPRLRISVRSAARELHGCPRAVLQWAEPQMPRCTALNRLGEPCKAARMRGRSTCFRHSGSAVAKRARLAAAHLSGDLDRIQRAEIRSERNRLRALWRRDPREPGRTIILAPADEATCRAWAARQGFQLDLLDRDFPAFSDACRWIWARMSRGLIGDDDLAAKLTRLRNRITEASRAFDYSG